MLYSNKGDEYMKPTIENPKVFISYAWGDPEYQERVLAFATDLMSDGIDVLFDKWSLKEGNDTHFYMEKCVNDPTVTNVILLLDPLYEQKSNSRTGGVGEETQIISPEIYNKVEQEKFLPVVFKRNNDGSIPKPHFLKGLLHFDLSIPDKYSDEYKRLVKRLNGIEIIKKPELGNTPSWVFEESIATSEDLLKLESIKSNKNTISQKDDFIELLDKLKIRIVDYSLSDDDPLKWYESLQTFRDKFLLILKYSHSIPESTIVVCDFLESLRNALKHESIYGNSYKLTLIHELFIYTIAFYLKQKDYSAVKTIFNNPFIIDYEEEHSFKAFYHYNQSLEIAKSQKDEKRYRSGTAQIFMDNINLDFCSKREFCFADELCYNYTMINDLNFWFPITYIYDGGDEALIRHFSKRLISKTWAEKVSDMFGFNNLNDFNNAVDQLIEKCKNDYSYRTGYSGAFNQAPLITDYINIDEIGTM